MSDILAEFAASMGPADDASEALISRRKTSPFFAALVNGAASHFAGQDDVHNGSVFHSGTVVFPPVLAVAQAGYETGIRVGDFLGRSHYKVFHTTGTAQAAGPWEFLRDAADSKQLHAAKAAADDLSAYLAQSGSNGAKHIFEGPQGMSTDSDPAKLVDRLGTRWALTETSFKYHACCRHCSSGSGRSFTGCK
jgi:2-methylcitrate dehydratase PrpD